MTAAPSPQPDSDEWTYSGHIRDLPEVDEAIRNFLIDSTGGNATCMVRAILRAAHPTTAPAVHARITPESADAVKGQGPAPAGVQEREAWAWGTPGGDVSRSLKWCQERCLPDGEQPFPLYRAALSSPAVAPVRMLTDDEATQVTREAARGSAIKRAGTTSLRVADAIQRKFIEVNGLSPAVAHEPKSNESPFTFHWLVELRPAFEGHPAFPATYYAGWIDGIEAAKTTDPMEAVRFTSKEHAERMAKRLGFTLSCVWQAIEHGFASREVNGLAPAVAAPSFDGVKTCSWPSCGCDGLLDKPKSGECQGKVWPTDGVALPRAPEPHHGLYALQDVVRCLRETGRFVDEEGEATNALDDLAQSLTDGVDTSDGAQQP
jgi:hypothetical protein